MVSAAGWHSRTNPDRGRHAAIDPDDAERLFREGALLVDVRETVEWNHGHVPGSINMPLSGLSQRIGELDHSALALVICHTGSRSMVAVRMLAARGVKQVYNVRGGTIGWRRRGLPFAV